MTPSRDMPATRHVPRTLRARVARRPHCSTPWWWLAATLALLTAAPAMACPMAYHNRLVPVGASGDDIIAVRVNLTRDADAPGEELRWKGDAVLVALDDGEVARELGRRTVDIADKAYADGLREVVAELLDNDGDPHDFRRLDAPTVALCPFESSCDGVSVAGVNIETVTLNVPAATIDAPNEARRLSAPLPAPVVEALRLASGMDSPEASEQLLSAADFAVVSVRRFAHGKRVVVVAHLARGVEDFATHVITELPAASCSAAETCTYIEPTLHHGEAFDVLVTLPQ